MRFDFDYFPIYTQWCLKQIIYLWYDNTDEVVNYQFEWQGHFYTYVTEGVKSFTKMSDGKFVALQMGTFHKSQQGVKM